MTDEINGIFVGKAVGSLTVLERGPYCSDKTVWKCQCSCGNIVVASTNNLSKGKVKDCGKHKKPKVVKPPKVKVVKPVKPPKMAKAKVSQKIPMIGRTFGKLTVLSEVATESKVDSSKVRWNCQCECGNTVEATGCDLRRGIKTHCGCGKVKKLKVKIYKVRKSYSKVGQKIGKLTVLALVSGTNTQTYKYKCLCECGNMVEVNHTYLQSNRSNLSCGCLRKTAHTKISLKLSKDLTGNTYGLLTAIARGPRKKSSCKSEKFYTTWTCKCACGNVVDLDTSKLAAGRYVSCGCLTPKASKELGKHRQKKESRHKDPLRRSPEYAKWRSAVFAKDGYNCVKCGGKQGGLNAHHIEDYESNPALRLDVANGVTLCVKCHKDFHNIYGWAGRTTEEQLKEFLG